MVICRCNNSCNKIRRFLIFRYLSVIPKTVFRLRRLRLHLLRILSRCPIIILHQHYGQALIQWPVLHRIRR